MSKGIYFSIAEIFLSAFKKKFIGLDAFIISIINLSYMRLGIYVTYETNIQTSYNR